MRNEFRRYRRYGRRTVASWSRRGYRSRRCISSKKVNYSSLAHSSSVEQAPEPSTSRNFCNTRSTRYGSTGMDGFFPVLCIVIGVFLFLNFFILLL